MVLRSSMLSHEDFSLAANSIWNGNSVQNRSGEGRSTEARRPHVAARVKVVHRVSSSLLGPEDPSFRALSGRIQFTVRRHKLNEDSFSVLIFAIDFCKMTFRTLCVR
jgi:hypothetical protein